MLQGPDPNIDPNLILTGIIPIFGMLTGIVITGFVVLGPVGRAVADVLRRIFGADRKQDALSSADVDDLRQRLDGIQQHLAELMERQDFAERLLAQARREKALPGASDVAG